MMAYAVRPERSQTESGTFFAGAPINARRLNTSIDMKSASSAITIGTNTPPETNVFHTRSGPASRTT
jgi:hypothetical protein